MTTTTFSAITQSKVGELGIVVIAKTASWAYLTAGLAFLFLSVMGRPLKINKILALSEFMVK